jgi:diguanylate cyclase (GGDEF)-like protein
MTARNSIISMLFVCLSCLAAMFFVEQRWQELVAGPVSQLVPFISIILFVVVIFTLALRQALTMYVASIIALSTIAHFYVLPFFNEQQAILNPSTSLNLQTEHLLLSFIVLLPIFGLIKIPAHRLVKSFLYLLGSLIAWVFFSIVISKAEPIVYEITGKVFSSIAMHNPFESFWFTPLESALICVTLLAMLVIVLSSHKNLYLLTIAIMAGYVIAKPSPTSIVLLACLASLLCLYSAIMNSRNMAFNDELTGIPARRSMSQYADELSRHFTLVMIDIDHFKRFNDKYGHDSGDDVLKLVASKIGKTRNGARAFRYGGEEFTLVFDGKYMDDVRETIEDLRVEIESYPMAIRVQKRSQKSASQSRNRRQSPLRQEIVKVTCSFGIAESLSGSKDFKTTLKRADNALYKAKKAGRNCVRTA